MTDETRIKFIGAGLILVTVVVALVVFSKRMAAPKIAQLDIAPIVQASPVPTTQVLPAPIAQGNLPKTGFPVGLFVIFSASAALAGWGLRKFPN